MGRLRLILADDGDAGDEKNDNETSHYNRFDVGDDASRLLPDELESSVDLGNQYLLLLLGGKLQRLTIRQAD